jgi:hypothetical protein
MQNVFRVALLIAVVLLLFHGLWGCKAGKLAKVGVIEGPNLIYETTHGYYRIHYEGTGATYQWSCFPPDAGTFENPTSVMTKFIAGAVSEDTIIEIRVLLETEQMKPVLQKRNITIKKISGFYVSEIEGPESVQEFNTVTYSVLAGGDTGIAYSWTVDPTHVGIFGMPDETATDFTAEEVVVNTLAEVRVVVYSDHHAPEIKTMDITIKNGPGFHVSEIFGPDLVNENSFGDYYIEATGDSGITFAWSVDPPSVGNFNNPAIANPRFTAGGVSVNTPAQLQVIVDPDHYDPVTKTKNITILAESPFGWAKNWGDFGIDQADAIAVDPLGYIYATGEFHNIVDFDPGPGTSQHSSNGGSDIFLSKFSSMGDLQWVRTWGGHYSDGGRSVAVDLGFNVYVTGYWRYSCDFHPDPWQDDVHMGIGYDDIFLSKFDAAGNYQWAQTWGGVGEDHGQGVATDSSGYPYVTGYFEDTVDFDPSSFGIDEHTANGPYEDAFISKFNSFGTYQWANTWGGSYGDRGEAVDVTPTGTPCVAGYFQLDVDFDPGPGVDMHYSNGQEDAYLLILSPTPQALTWGGASLDKAEGIAIDPLGNIFATGRFNGTVDFDPGGGTANYSATDNYADAYLSAFSNAGAFKWARTWGGTNEDVGRAVTTDGTGNAYVTGQFRNSIQLDTGGGLQTYYSSGMEDVFLCIFDPSGNPTWVGTWGGISVDGGSSVAVDSTGNIYTGGWFSGSADFDPTAAVVTLFSHGMYDAFLCKFLPQGL